MNADVAATASYQAAEVYEKFFVRGMFRYWTPVLLQRAAPREGERVLDVACGTGVVARSTVPLVGPSGKVVGLDINPAMLAVACRQFSDHCDDIDWQEGRAEDLPFGDHEFDLVTCQQGFQFFVDKGKAAREMRRVLRPEGRAVLAVWQSLDF
ncbi:MAG: class I SAM-dependent methyltransferase, partial [Bacteroidota bacterium]